MYVYFRRLCTGVVEGDVGSDVRSSDPESVRVRR